MYRQTTVYGTTEHTQLGTKYYNTPQLLCLYSVGVYYYGAIVIAITKVQLIVQMDQNIKELEVFEEYLPRAEYSRDMHRYTYIG